MRQNAPAAEADPIGDSLFGTETPLDISADRAEKRLRKELDDEIKRGGKAEAAKTKPRLAEIGHVVAGEPAEKVTGDAAPEVSENSNSGDEIVPGFLGEPVKSKKTKKGKSYKKDSKKAKKDSKKKESTKDKKKKKKDSSSSSSSTSSSALSSSVFRVGKTGNDRISQARMIQWAEDHPGLTALQLLRKMKNVVGEDGEKVDKTGAAPAVAKQFDLRILKHQSGPGGPSVRNQREMTTLCVMLDHLALGRYRQAADVAAARLKSIEGTNRDGHFHQSQFLELIPVNMEGLTTADEKLLVKNETLLNQKSLPSSGDGWQNYGKGDKGNSSYHWIPQPKGKGKKDGGKRKKGAQGKKGEGKGKEF